MNQQVLVNFKMDRKMKTDLDNFAKDVNLPVSSVLTLLCDYVIKHHEFPFVIRQEPSFEERRAKTLSLIQSLNELRDAFKPIRDVLKIKTQAQMNKQIKKWRKEK